MDYVDAWILMWGLLYVFNAILKPDATVKPKVNKYLGGFTLLAMGAAVLLSLHFDNTLLYAALGVLMSAGCMASYYGLIIWNVPRREKNCPANVRAQQTMAAMNLVAAVVFFSKVT